MAGYCGYSMSRNAVDAYRDGERPLSKWTKGDMLSELKKAKDELGCDFKRLEGLKLSVLKELCLVRTSWHHTSKFYNATDFYSVREDVENITEESVNQYKQRQDKQKDQTEIPCVCKYLVWGGTRRYPRAKECVSEGVIKGNWFYLPDGTKKNINAKGFKIIVKR